MTGPVRSRSCRWGWSDREARPPARERDAELRPRTSGSATPRVCGLAAGEARGLLVGSEEEYAAEPAEVIAALADARAAPALA